MEKERLRAYREMKEEKSQLEHLLEEVETEDLRALYREKVKALEAEQLEIERAIDSLGNTERMVLRYYYIDGLTWEETAVKSGYAWAQTHRIHRRALEQLREQEKSHL